MTDRERAAARFEWITVKAYAEMLKVAPKTVRRWLKEGAVQDAERHGARGHWRIKVVARR